VRFPVAHQAVRIYIGAAETYKRARQRHPKLSNRAPCPNRRVAKSATAITSRFTSDLRTRKRCSVMLT
jgi:hypothetical protein